MAQAPRLSQTSYAAAARPPGIPGGDGGAGMVAAGADRLGRSLARLGALQAERDLQAAEAMDQKALVDGLLTARRWLNDWQESARTDSAFHTVGDRLTAAAQEIKTEVMGRLRGERPRAAFEQQFGLLLEGARMAARDTSFQNAKSEFVASLAAQANETLQGMGSADDAGRVVLKSAMMASIDAGVEGGWLAPAEAERQRQAFDQGAAAAIQDRAELDMMALIDADPASARREIKRHPGLPERSKLTLMRDADRREREMEAAEDRARAQAQEGRAGELRVLAMDGKITERDLTQDLARRRISPGQFDTLLRFMRTEAGASTDRETALDLQLGLYQGRYDFDDVAARKDKLAPDDLNRMLALADQVSRRDGVLARGDVRRERARIDSIIGGVRGPLAVLDTASSERLANALDDYDQAVLGGTDPRAAADNVIQSYRAQPPSVRALPRSQFWSGANSGLVSDPAILRRDLAAARQKAIAAFDAGKLTEQALARELTLLKRYQAAIEQMPTPEPVRQR